MSFIQFKPLCNSFISINYFHPNLQAIFISVILLISQFTPFFIPILHFISCSSTFLILIAFVIPFPVTFSSHLSSSILIVTTLHLSCPPHGPQELTLSHSSFSFPLNPLFIYVSAQYSNLLFLSHSSPSFLLTTHSFLPYPLYFSLQLFFPFILLNPLWNKFFPLYPYDSSLYILPYPINPLNPSIQPLLITPTPFKIKYNLTLFSF